MVPVQVVLYVYEMETHSTTMDLQRRTSFVDAYKVSVRWERGRRVQRQCVIYPRLELRLRDFERSQTALKHAEIIKTPFQKAVRFTKFEITAEQRRSYTHRKRLPPV